MTAASLMVVFIVARALVVIGVDVTYSVWSPVAYLWQDVMIVLLFAGVSWIVRSRQCIRLLYGLFVLQAALTVPLVRETGSPMTWPMLRATRGTLSGSIAHTVTAPNLVLIGIVIAVGCVMPLVLRRTSPRKRWAVAAVAVGILTVAAGPHATSRVDTAGYHRNGLVAFARSAALYRAVSHRIVSHGAERAATSLVARDWSASPFPSPLGRDLRSLRAEAAGRNVVFVLLESTGAGHLRPYGAELDPMPHLTRLTSRSLLMENAYTVYPESIKGLLGVIASTPPALGSVAEDYEDLAVPALPALLRNAGYHTGMFHSGRFGYLGMEAVIQGRGYDVLEDAGDIGGERRSSFGVDDRATVDRALQWIDGVPPGELFFVTLLPVSGHHPYDVPEPGPFGGAEEIDGYRDALHYSDRMLHRFMEGIEARGLGTQTLTVIIGDHGEAFGEHEGNYGHVFCVYEENVRIPMIFHAPGLLDDAGLLARVASTLDIAPTVLDLLGLPIPAAYRGASLLEPAARMALFLADYSEPLVGLRDGRWKFIHDLDSGRMRLFDLIADPRERVDLAPGEPQRANAYREHLRGWVAAIPGS